MTKPVTANGTQSEPTAPARRRGFFVRLPFPKEPMPTASIIIPCKGRLAHLRECLPAVLAQGANLEAVIVDYACPDRCGDWAEALGDPRIRVVRPDAGPGEWNYAAARNAGFRAAASDALCFSDADILPPAGWLAGVLSAWTPGRYVLPEGDGCLFVRRSDFVAAGGYNEAHVHGWGWTDVDLMNRLSMRGVRRQTCPSARRIPHGDDLRNRYHGGRPRAASVFANQCVREFRGIDGSTP